MKAKLVSFGQLDVGGERYDYDVVIEEGKVRKRSKKPSKVFRDRYGHTPLSVAEDIPWRGKTLYIGTGTYGSLPIMPEVHQEAERRKVKLIAVPTEEACRLLGELNEKNVHAVLHTTC